MGQQQTHRIHVLFGHLLYRMRTSIICIYPINYQINVFEVIKNIYTGAV